MITNIVYIDLIPEQNRYIRLVKRSDQKMWDGDSWETAPTHADQATDLAENEDIGGYYFVAFPSTDADVYDIFVYNGTKAGATDEDIALSSFEYVWNGTEQITPLFVANIMVGDAEIDKTTTPWQLVIKKKDGVTELFRKDLFDVDGNNITDENTPIGQHVEPT